MRHSPVGACPDGLSPRINSLLTKEGKEQATAVTREKKGGVGGSYKKLGTDENTPSAWEAYWFLTTMRGKTLSHASFKENLSLRTWTEGKYERHEHLGFDEHGEISKARSTGRGEKKGFHGGFKRGKEQGHLINLPGRERSVPRGWGAERSYPKGSTTPRERGTAAWFTKKRVRNLKEGLQDRTGSVGGAYDVRATHSPKENHTRKNQPTP